MNAPAMLDRLHRRLIELQPGRVGSPVLQKSLLGQAIRCTIGQWAALVRSLEDGRYEIDTNLVENAIRPTCIGKKNWLFIGHPDAGWRSAVICSLLITARRYDLDPAAWLGDVLRRIATCTSANLAELLPWNWEPLPA
jgi:transposase